MTSSCILHIGMHKTGSTSIQHSLDGFEDSRFLYARLSHDPNHSLAMFSLFAPQPELHHIHRNNGADVAAVADYRARMQASLERAIEAARGRTLIISGEDISALRGESVVRLRDYFDRRFDEVTVVGYVRSPAALMSSTLQHRIRTGAVDHFDLTGQYRSYQATFSGFDEAFGRNRVKLWKFDPGTFPDGCVVRDFCSRLGITLPEERIVRLNESLPRQLVSLLYTYHRKSPHAADLKGGPANQRLLNKLNGFGGGSFRLSPDLTRPILERERADIAWMEARLGETLQENLEDHRPGDVRSEADLLRPDPEIVARLRALLGKAVPAGVTGQTPEEVAMLVHAVRLLQPRPTPMAYLRRGVGALRRLWRRR